MKTPHELKIEALEKKLNGITGKAMFHKDKIITIQSFKIFSTAVNIRTTNSSYSLELHLVDKFLEELSGEIPANFSPIDTTGLIDEDEKPIKYKLPEITQEQLKKNEQMESNKIAEQSQEKENQLYTTSDPNESSNIEVLNYKPTKENVQVKEALMDMLKKVSASPNTIPQAKAVCDIANTMVNIQKNEIQMIQMVNRIKS
jgi:hypothetical protein